ncbi:MAG: hypothetical protein HOQ05_03900 [Corynebacteriales bacterium]|nr:hypothetical protein [Mycobacteriales bacterium]
MVNGLGLLRRLLRVAAYVSAGIAVAFVLLGALDAGAEVPGFGAVFGLLVLAVALFGLASAASVAFERAQLTAERDLATTSRRLTDDEWEAEGRRETPRLAREYGRATLEPAEEDRPALQRPWGEL